MSLTLRLSGKVAARAPSWVWRIAIHRLIIAAYDMSQRLFVIQSSLGVKYGIRSLATDPVHILVKLIDDTRSRQTVEPLAQ
jgi:hypothetical protein